MTRPKKPGALTLKDRAMIEALFDTGTRDNAIALLRQCGDPVPLGYRASLADTLDRELVAHLRTSINRLYESGRGQQASEFDDTDTFLRTVENAACILRLTEGGTMGGAEAGKLADDLEAAWLRFAANASAYRMYDDLLRERANQKKASDVENVHRKEEADDDALLLFNNWQVAVKTQLVRNGEPMSAHDRLQRYKIAKKPVPDRLWRRLRRLLDEGRIPPL